MVNWSGRFIAALSAQLMAGAAVLAAGGNITGQVVDGKAGAPLGGANVWLQGTRMGTASDGGGRYAVRDVPAGTYVLQASMTGYTSVTREHVAVREGEEVTVDFALPLKLARMEEVVVTATRVPRMIRDVPVNTSVLTAEDLDRSVGQEIDDVLRLTPGIDIDRPAGVLYTTPTVSMRGMGGRTAEGRTLVLLDGVPVNDAYTGGVAWNSFSTADVERIEVVRGAGSALYGANAMGGVINLITRGWSQRAQTTAKLSYGGQHTPRAEVYHSAWMGRLGYAVESSYLSSDGYIVVPEDQRKEYDRERSMDQRSIGGKLRWTLAPDASLTLSASHYAEEANAGRPLYVGSSSQDQYSLNCAGGLGGIDWQGALFARFDDSEWTYDTGANRDKVNYVSEQPRKQWGLSGRTTLNAMPASKLTLAVDARWGRINADDRYVQAVRQVETTGKQWSFGLSAEEEFAPGDRLRLTAGARYDHVRTYDGSSLDTNMGPEPMAYPDKSYDQINPRVGVVYHPDKATTVRASVGRAFQAPNLYNLYRTTKFSTTTYAGNPDLDPEWLTSYEVGVDRTFASWLLARITLYRNDADDFIYSITTDPVNKVATKQNVGNVEMQGVEAEVSLFPVKGAALSAAYTLNESTIEEFAGDTTLTGKSLIYAPRHKLAIMAGFDDPRWLAAHLTGRLVGERFTDDANSDDKALDRYLVMDLKLARRIAGGLELNLAIANLLDEQYEEKSGFMAPGRLVRGGLVLRR